MSAVTAPPITLLLHFDVNKTLIAEDPAGDKPIERVLKSALAEDEISRFKWDGQTSQTYRQYVQAKLRSENPSGTNLKPLRLLAIDRLFDELVRVQHPRADEIHRSYNHMLAITQDHYVYPAFFKLLRTLDKCEIGYRIILRTFGEDLSKVTEYLEQQRSDLRFVHSGAFHGGRLHVGSKVLERSEEIYRVFRDAEPGHFAIQDNWKEWHDTGELAAAGKCFAFDPHDETTLSLFFDDNAIDDLQHPDNGQGCVAPRDTQGITYPVHTLLDKQVFVVNLINAMLDDEDQYFVQLVDRALKAHGHSGIDDK